MYNSKFSIFQPCIIAGPCAAESEVQMLTTAQALAEIGVKIFRAGVWKPRSKPNGFEGVGAAGLQWLQKVRSETGMKVATEVATSEHVELALKHDIDILWLGARTTTNPFAVQEIADALRGAAEVTVFVKNPDSPDLDLWLGALERLHNAEITRIAAIHRGFSSYNNKLYRNAPHWSIPIELKRIFPDLPLLCDPSHIGGKRALVATIAQQAIDLNFNGLFVESHCCPENAKSDAAQQVTPEELRIILENLVVRNEQHNTEKIVQMRRQIDEIDDNLLNLLLQRMKISDEIGAFKKTYNMPVLQQKRYEEILKKRLLQASEIGLSPDFVKKIFENIHEQSVERQIHKNP
jgi:chorismate mutase